MELNIRNDSDRIQNVPIQCKMTLTIREAAEYSNRTLLFVFKYIK